MQLSYEELSANVLDGVTPSDECMMQLRNERFDAVLLGLGSLSHVLAKFQRRRLLNALNVLCPSGPIMVSFSSNAALTPRRGGRASSLGCRVGRAIAHLRAIHREDGSLTYGAQYGFAYSFTPSALEALARAAGRSVSWERSDGARADYATLLRA